MASMERKARREQERRQRKEHQRTTRVLGGMEWSPGLRELLGMAPARTDREILGEIGCACCGEHHQEEIRA